MGSLAAAGLSTGALAADLGVVTSLDLCDALGISGLTISSDANCLKITGEVRYGASWGTTTFTPAAGAAVSSRAWDSRLRAWVQFAATSETDFGLANAVIRLRVDERTIGAAVGNPAVGAAVTTGNNVQMERAYVTIGNENLLLLAGKIASGQSAIDGLRLKTPKLFGNPSGTTVRHGGLSTVWDAENRAQRAPGEGTNWGLGGHSLQAFYDVGNNLVLGAALENIDGGVNNAVVNSGTAIGTIKYSGGDFSANAAIVADGINNGVVRNWGLMASARGTFDQFSVYGSFDYNHFVPANTSAYEALVGANFSIDMFTLRGYGAFFSSNHTGATINGNAFGIAAEVKATDTVALIAGYNWLDNDTAVANNETYNAFLGVIADVTENVAVGAKIGSSGLVTLPAGAANTVYGEIGASWKPGGGFESAVTLGVSSSAPAAGTTTAFYVDVEAKKSF